ncbi:DUF6376 family protein [Neobacillus sp. FSL H8-0543]|uniref:DUF6376 family protein n=1 Tax=Neobacillus sp. FSL H8-0543 TaxID=2954672 RepID=UPI003157F9A5
MKKWLVIFSASVVLFLGGCSFLNDAKDTLTYVNDATDYLAVATDFANQAPALAQQAISDVQAAEDLESILQEMQQKLEGFNDLQAPEVVADLHQQIVEKNNIIADGIETYLNNIKDGLLDATILENTELFQSAQEITSIIDQIQQLGGE